VCGHPASADRGGVDITLDTALGGLVALLAAAVLAAVAGRRMAQAARAADPRPSPVDEQTAGLSGLVLGCLAVAAAAVGATLLSSGELSARGLAPYALAVLVVALPLAASAARDRRSRTRARSGR
jgi:hypothetical protein